MKKIVPFKKEIKLEEDFMEIVSIALEHTYKKENNIVLGDFILSGEYKGEDKINDFNYKIPFQINLDEKYDLSNIDVSIEDFYYEINDKKLLFNIELSIDNLSRCVEEEFKEIEPVEVKVSEEKEEIKEEIKEENENVYTTYKVYIVLENDTIEGICNKYNITKEELEKYNDLSNIKPKDKVIIPYIFNEQNK